MTPARRGCNVSDLSEPIPHNIGHRDFRRRSWRRGATDKSAGHDRPDRGTVALQDFEANLGCCIPYNISDCLAGSGRRTKKNVRPHARMNSHYPLAVHGLKVGDGELPVEVFARQQWRGRVGISRIFGYVASVLEVQDSVDRVDP